MLNIHVRIAKVKHFFKNLENFINLIVIKHLCFDAFAKFPGRSMNIRQDDKALDGKRKGAQSTAAERGLLYSSSGAPALILLTALCCLPLFSCLPPRGLPLRGFLSPVICLLDSGFLRVNFSPLRQLLFPLASRVLAPSAAADRVLAFFNFSPLRVASGLAPQACDLTQPAPNPQLPLSP